MLVLQSYVVKLSVLGSCKFSKPTYYELMEEPMDKTVTPSVAVSKVWWSSIFTRTVSQIFWFYASKVTWEDQNTWQILAY